MKKEGMRAALYARCSTHDKGQDPELQLSPFGNTVKGEDSRLPGNMLIMESPE